MSGLPNSAIQKLEALRDDFQYYAQHCLWIRTKNGELEPLELNRAQQYIHRRLEAQRLETGKVRAVILKGRQQGCSTYVEGRFYHATSQHKGVRAFILTHEQEATNNLFEMAQRYHDHCPGPLKPKTGAANAKELHFADLDSGYKVGTAGTRGVGRSSTVQYFHGSEVAFWPFAEEHAKGVLQAIPDAPGTEIILESTANGLGNYFHQQWKRAEAGEGDFIPIFVPWFWQAEYRRPTNKNFRRTDDEVELVRLYGIDDEQLLWRRSKIIELSVNGADGLRAFQQEYPMNASEAFQVSGGDGLINPDNVMRARKNTVNGNGPLIVGVDPSRGGDRFTTIKRQGRKAYDAKGYTGGQVDKLGKQVAICKVLLDTVDPLAGKAPDMMFIDAGGGADLVDRLHELGYEKRVKAVAFGAHPLNPERSRNKRCEIWQNLNDWLTDETLDVQVPDSDEVQADLCASPYYRDSHDRVCLYDKDWIKKHYGFSPDYGDALALTFAEPVRNKAANVGLTVHVPNSWMG